MGPAWLVAGTDGAWVARKGRVPDGFYDEKKAVVRMAEMVREDSDAIARATRDREAAANRPPTFREVAQSWLQWHDELSGATPKTREDYRYMLADPGTPWKRGTGTYAGVIMDAFGDRPAQDITTLEIRKFLVSLDRAGKKARNVNKHRHVLHSIFNYAMQPDTFALPFNPVTPCETRKEMPPAALDFFEPKEVEQLAQAAAQGLHRKPPVARGGGLRDLTEDEIEARRAEDLQDADLFRVLAFTGMRIGEAVVLRVGDVDLVNRRLIVQRALSGSEEAPPRAGRSATCPSRTSPTRRFTRVLDRQDFCQRDDYVFINRVGGRLSISAVRRRWHAARRTPACAT